MFPSKCSEEKYQKFFFWWDIWYENIANLILTIRFMTPARSTWNDVILYSSGDFLWRRYVGFPFRIIALFFDQAAPGPVGQHEPSQEDPPVRLLHQHHRLCSQVLKLILNLHWTVPLKGVSHEIFKVLFWHVWIDLGLYKNLWLFSSHATVLTNTKQLPIDQWLNASGVHLLNW